MTARTPERIMGRAKDGGTVAVDDYEYAIWVVGLEPDRFRTLDEVVARLNEELREGLAVDEGVRVYRLHRLRVSVRRSVSVVDLDVGAPPPRPRSLEGDRP